MRLHQNEEPTRGGVDDRGSTFLEVLVSVVLLGVSAVAVLAGLAASIRGASVHSDVAEAQSWLATAGDALIDVPPEGSDNYVACTVPSNEPTIVGQYQAVVDSVPGIPTSSDITVVDVEYWNSTAGSFGDDCRYAASEEDRLQRITLATLSAGARRELQVVKRPALEPTINVGSPPTTLGGGNYEPIPNPDLVP